VNADQQNVLLPKRPIPRHTLRNTACRNDEGDCGSVAELNGPVLCYWYGRHMAGGQNDQGSKQLTHTLRSVLVVHKPSTGTTVWSSPPLPSSDSLKSNYQSAATDATGSSTMRH